MFDTIICEYKLPMPDDPKGYTGSYNFQTKDFDCSLDYYKIDCNGTLFILRQEGKFIEGDKNSKNLFDRLGHFKVEKEFYEPVNDTTTIEMYDFQHSDASEYDFYICYKICFVKGIVTDIFIHEFEVHANAERKKRDKDRNEQIKKNDQLRKTYRYKYIYAPYNKSLRFIFKILYKINSFYNRNIIKLENKLRI